MPSSTASSGSDRTLTKSPRAFGTHRAAALLLWPRLDPEGLRRAGDDPLKLARLAERRTGIPRDEIIGMLERVARTLPPNPPSQRRVPISIRPDRVPVVRPSEAADQAAGQAQEERPRSSA